MIERKLKLDSELEDTFNRRIGDVECIYVLDFLRQLWDGGFLPAGND